ncbi:Major facilitator superfamily domain [Trinorchestia longiramus]|nr:Major facilitator superfamily domain [Trinorchestia longiramus]
MDTEATYHQLGRLVSESAFEREDPGSNPAADMVDAARNTAWDLGTSGPGLFGILRRIYVSPAELERRKVKLDIWKSIIVLSIAIFLAFTCYNALVIIHLNINPPLGALSIAIIIVVMAMCATFAPVLTIRKLGHKSTIAFGLLIITVYCGAQFHPMYYTAIPAAMLMGIQGSTLWTAVFSYIVRTGEKFAELNSEEREVCITRFFGTLFMLHQISLTVGYVAISEGFLTNTTNVRVNGTPTSSCGFHYCSDNNSTASPLSGEEFSRGWIILTGVAFGLSLLAAFLVSYYANRLPDLVGDWKEDGEEPPSVGRLLVAPLVQCVQPYMLLLMPLTVWAGAEISFIVHVFSMGFVACGAGEKMTGYVILTFASSSALCSSGSSFLVHRLGRRSIFLSAGFINLSMILLMLNWEPESGHLPLYFIVAAIWGVADAVWHTQLSALYGVLLPANIEAVFSVFVLWHSLGYLSVFLTHSLLCVDASVYILLMLLFSGVIGYLCVEIVESKRYGNTDPTRLLPIN